MPSPTFNRHTPDDKKRLKRLKLSLWVLTIIFVIHGLGGRFPEVFPITRWAMFSGIQYEEIELSTRIARYWVEIVDVNGDTKLWEDRALSGVFRFNSASNNLMRLNLYHIADNPDMSSQGEAVDFVLEAVNRRHPNPIQQVNIYLYIFNINYDEYPTVNLRQADEIRLLATIDASTKTVERFEDEVQNG